MTHLPSPSLSLYAICRYTQHLSRLVLEVVKVAAEGVVTATACSTPEQTGSDRGDGDLRCAGVVAGGGPTNVRGRVG